MAFIECRIRGFDALADSFGHDPTTLAKWVRRVMTTLVEPVHAVEGAIAVLFPGGFSACFSSPDHTRHAFNAALGMIAAADRLNQTSEPPVAIGIGIATGVGILGDFGTEDRPLVAAIGHGANVAAALAKSSAAYGVAMLAAPAPQEAAEPLFAMLQVDNLPSPEGQAAPLYTLLPPPLTRGHPKFLALKAFHAHILEACRAREWQLAKEKIAQARALSGANAVLYDLYLERIAHYELYPPGEDWPGALVEIQI
jgi:adenylate cyclase